MDSQPPKGNTSPGEVFTTSTTHLDAGLLEVSKKTSKTKKIKQVMKMKTKKDKIRMAIAILGFLAALAIIIVGAVLGAKAARNKDDGDDKTTPAQTSTTTEAPPTDSFRLPTTIEPLHYWVTLKPFINGNFTIDGHVQLDMKVVNATDRIILHMLDIVTHNKTLKVERQSNNTEIKVNKQEYDAEKQWYIVYLDEQVLPDQYLSLSVRFTGLLNDQLRGFYRSSYTDSDGNIKWLAVSQFEPADARLAFPCMDEPAFKARFTITLAREESMKAVSNMPVATPPSNTYMPIADEDGWVWDTFQESEPMSTYLVAFLISDFESNYNENGTFGVWSRNEMLDQTEKSLEYGPRILSFFGDYFNLSYPLPKMDLAAIPDFSAGAMENWGLVTFREEDMLLPPNSSASVGQRVAVVVAHELAHQWFGNLVTPSWWTDIWLNEGFASFMENIGADEVEPDWNLLQQMVLTMQMVMVEDGLTSTHPISQPIVHPDEIGQIFDSISYSKGMSVIRMMVNFLSDDTFRKGLNNYLSSLSFSSATQDDLWEFLTAAAVEDGRPLAGLTVKDVMDRWTLQAGYPVVTLTRVDEDVGTVAQERFLLAGNLSSEDSGTHWWVPLSYTTSQDPDFSNTLPKLWLPANSSEIILEGLPGKEDWILFNIQGTGYYRVNYDENNWDRLREQLVGNHTVIEVTTRSQLVDDALSLARAGRLEYSIALDLLNYLKAETEYVPWSSALTGLSYLEKMLTRTESYGDLRRYLLSQLQSLYDEIGFEDNLEDSHLDQLKRALAVSWVCKLGYETCVTKAVQLFNAWLQDETTEVSPNVKSTVYCTGVAEGGEEAWKKVWERYLNTEVASERTYLLRALGCAKESWLLAGYLRLAFAVNGEIRKQDSALVFSSVARNDVGRDLAWDYIREEFDHIGAYYTTFDNLGSLISVVTEEFNTRIQKEELEAFYKDHEEDLTTASRALQNALENAEGNIVWMENAYESIKNWLTGWEEGEDKV